MRLKPPHSVFTVVAALGLLAASSASEAAITLSPQLHIDAILTNPTGGFLLLLPASNPSCGSSGNQFNIVVGQAGMTAEGAKAALSAALTAYAIGKPIRVYFDPAISGCPVQQVYLE